MGNNQTGNGVDHYKAEKLHPPDGPPVATEVSHNSIIISWPPPRHSQKVLAYMVEYLSVKGKKWITVTNTCQGSSYKIRNLKEDTEYVFRVKAQNLCTKSKASKVSEIIRTKFKCLEDFDSRIESTRFIRTGSLNLKLNGGVKKLLQRNNTSPPAGGYDCEPANTSGTFQRGHMHSSLPPMSRRKTVQTLLPGLRRESVCSFKALENNQRLLTSSCNDSEDSRNNRDSLLEDSSDMHSTGRNSSDLSDHFSDVSSQSGSLNSSNSDYDSLRRSLRKRNNSNFSNQSKSGSLLTSPVSDHFKLELYISPSLNIDKEEEIVWENRDKENFTDFRTLRSILNSGELLIKPCDLNANICQSFEKHKLTTISDVDEDITEYAMITAL